MIKIHILLALSLAFAGCYKTSVADNGRIYEVNPIKIAYPTSETELIEVMQEADELQVPIIAAGKRHSQGGQSLQEDGIIVDINRMNRIIKLDVSNKWIIVESGVTWEMIQEAINPHGLAVKVMQSSNIFTVGGSLSVDAHGRDPNYGPLIESVMAIKVLTADRQSRWIDREHEPELFSLVIGGYGLFAFIVEAKLSLTDNHLLHKSAVTMLPDDYLSFFEREVQHHEAIGLHFARFYIGPDAPLSKLISVTYTANPLAPASTESLVQETHVGRNRFLLNLLRKTSWAKKSSWKFQVKEELKPQQISRNNAMRPPILALEYHSPYNSDILQEYIVPIRHFLAFTHKLQAILNNHPINLLNITVRYVPRNTESVLCYSQEDSFAFVLYVNEGLDAASQERATAWTRDMIDAALELDGTFYLPYQRYATDEQLNKAYPHLPYFLQKKLEYDPEELFQSEFYNKMLSNG